MTVGFLNFIAEVFIIDSFGTEADSGFATSSKTFAKGRSLSTTGLKLVLIFKFKFKGGTTLTDYCLCISASILEFLSVFSALSVKAKCASNIRPPVTD